MPIVNDEMSMEEAELIAKAAPKGKYLIEISKVFTTETGEVVFEKEETGNKMYRFGMKIVEGPYKDGVNQDEKGVNKDKQIKPYNAVFGMGFLAAFKRAFPDSQTEDGKTNTDLVVGLQAFADLKISNFEGAEGNEIAKLYPKN